MTAQITANISDVQKDTAINYTISITPETQISSALIEVIPSAECFPDMNIIPDTTSVTVSNGISCTSNLSENGIFEIDIPVINSS